MIPGVAKKKHPTFDLMQDENDNLLYIYILNVCDNINVSDQVALQYVISCVNFQTLQFYAFTALTPDAYCFASSILQVSGKQIHDMEVPAVQLNGHARSLEY